MNTHNTTHSIFVLRHKSFITYRFSFYILWIHQFQHDFGMTPYQIWLMNYMCVFLFVCFVFCFKNQTCDRKKKRERKKKIHKSYQYWCTLANRHGRQSFIVKKVWKSWLDVSYNLFVSNDLFASVSLIIRDNDGNKSLLTNKLWLKLFESKHSPACTAVWMFPVEVSGRCHLWCRMPVQNNDAQVATFYNMKFYSLSHRSLYIKHELNHCKVKFWRRYPVCIFLTCPPKIPLLDFTAHIFMYC